jgi:uncharacterized protein (TIGR03083 family)
MSHDGGMPQTSPAPTSPAPADLLAQLDAAAKQFAGLIATGDLAAPVPTCPDWTFADLAAHLGEIHQWAAHAIVAGNPDAQPIPAPIPQAALVDWYLDAADGLIAVLKETDPHAPAWGFGPKPRTASFWFRRQAHETTVHLWDAATSQGTSAPIDDTLARDGIDELTGMFFPRQVRLGRTPALERALALETAGTGPAHRWVLAGDGTGPASASDAEAQATVSGPAESLLLLLWGRTGPDDPKLTVTGDETAARAVLNAALAP